MYNKWDAVPMTGFRDVYALTNPIGGVYFNVRGYKKLSRRNKYDEKE